MPCIPSRDPAVLDDQDEVGGADGGQAVAMTSAVHPLTERLGQGVLDCCLGVGVEVGGGFVEEDDAGAGQEQAGDGEPLAVRPLIAGYPRSPTTVSR